MSIANQDSIGVIGAGAWGTALSCLLVEKNPLVQLWAYEEQTVKDINKKNTHTQNTLLTGHNSLAFSKKHLFVRKKTPAAGQIRAQQAHYSSLKTHKNT